MSFIKNQFDGQNHELIAEQKAFKKAMDKKAEEIVETTLPEMLRPIIMRAAEQLEADLPDELRKADPITHDVLNARGIYMRMLFAVANRLGHGASWLR
ncbi:hypothetical protein [Escherichia coli]|uniref:hypothetical protein n=1 Tax=Escherichia coli TaxID=562 RepID=UPI0031F30281